MKPLFITETHIGRVQTLRRSSSALHAQSAHVFESGRGAFEFLSKPDEVFSAIFLPIKSTSPSAFEMIYQARRFHPVTPIYLIRQSGEEIPQEEIQRLNITGYIDSFDKIEDYLRCTKDLPEAYRQKRNFDFTIPQSVLDQKIFIPVSIEKIIPDRKLFFDLYVHQIADRFKKIHSANEYLLEEKLGEFYAKGVSHFYLRRSSFERYLGYCKNLCETILERSQVSLEIKMLAGLTLNPALQDSLNTAESSRFQIDPVEEYVDKTFKWLFSLKQESQAALQTFLNSAHLLEHVTAVHVLCAFIAMALQIQSDESLRRLGVASLLHDIGLNCIPSELHHENRTLMSDEERKVFETHPQLGSQLLRDAGMDDDLILQLVSQHHERRNALGFPYRKSPSEINLLSEIIGVADEYLNYRRSYPEAFNDDIRNHFESYLFSGFSNEVAAAARKVFFTESNAT